MITLHEADWDEFQDQNLTVKADQTYHPPPQDSIN